ncbi:MAG: PIN domain-containing protein [Methylococcaceae bacterium]|nr:PIN domain-containing protein [Methylococcaceae bacterium]
MYLVDTSVWIDFIRGKHNPAVEQLRILLATGQSAGLSSVIYQEILQGSESEQRFNQFCDYFNELLFYHPKHPMDSYAQAAHLYFTCRQKGITIRSTIDCLIAQIAIEHDLILLHNDRDFKYLADIAPQLKVFSG